MCSIIISDLDQDNIQEMIQIFPGCCSNCQIKLKAIEHLKEKNEENIRHNSDENLLIKIQYKKALERKEKN